MTRFNKNADLYPALCGIEGLGTHLSKLHLNRAKLSNSLLAESRNPTVFPSGSIFTPYNNGSVVPITPHLVHNNRYPQQPTDQDQHMTDVRNVGVELQPEGLSGQEGPPSTGAELGPPIFVPTPSSGVSGFQDDNLVGNHLDGPFPQNCISCRSITGPSRTRTHQRTGFTPYGAYTARSMTQPAVALLKLRIWAKERMGTPNNPPASVALAAALEVIPNIRNLVNQEPLPVNNTVEAKPYMNKSRMSRKAQRDRSQEPFQKLSRYYSQSTEDLQFLSELVKDLKAHPDL